MGRVGRNGSEQYVSLYLFPGLLQRILDWKEAIMEFFNFLNFFAIFYYASGRNRTEQNNNFYFLYFLAFFNLFWLEMKPQRYFLIFWLFYWNFLLRIGLERNGTERQFLFCYFPILLWPILASNESLMIFFNFYNFFATFLEFSIMRRVGTKCN